MQSDFSILCGYVGNHNPPMTSQFDDSLSFAA